MSDTGLLMNQTPARWILLAFLVLLSAVGAAADELPRLQRFVSEHYLIHTDLPRGEVVPLGRHMDAVFAQYQRRFSGFAQRNAEPMPLYLFRHRADYIAFLDRHGIDASNSAGMFFLRPEVQGLATWTSGHSRSEVFATLQHEGFHQFAWSRIGRDLPIWINEGLAQYFEDAIVVGDRMTTGLASARRIELVKAAMQRDELVPLAELIISTEADWNAALTTDPRQAALMYAQSWSLVYYLVHGRDGRLQKPFERYLWLLSRGWSSSEALQEAFGVRDVTPVERQWRRYAADHEPDALNTAIARIEFLAVALRFLNERGQKPVSISDLRDELQTRQFSVTRTSHGLETQFHARDESLYRYPYRQDDEAWFEVLPSPRGGLPPRIRASRLSPTPTLVWRQDSEGELVQDIEYR